MGLPARARCPRVGVRRAEGAIELRFTGPGCEARIDVDLALLGPQADAEEAELRLLVRLRELGYAVTRLPPEE